MTDSVIRWIVAVFFVFFIADRSFSIIMSMREPFVWNGRGAWIEPPTVKVGEQIRANYQFYRYFYCNTDLNRFIENADNNYIVWRDRTPSGATVLGQSYTVNPIKADLPPGKYVLRTILFSACTNGTHVQAAPDAPFTVVGK